MEERFVEDVIKHRNASDSFDRCWLLPLDVFMFSVAWTVVKRVEWVLLYALGRGEIPDVDIEGPTLRVVLRTQVLEKPACEGKVRQHGQDRSTC